MKKLTNVFLATKNLPENHPPLLPPLLHQIPRAELQPRVELPQHQALQPPQPRAERPPTHQQIEQPQVHQQVEQAQQPKNYLLAQNVKK